MPAAAPQHVAGSRNGPKVPPLRAAASSPSARGRALATGLTGSRLPELAPSPQCPLRVRDGAARAEWRGSVAQGISAVLVPTRSRPKEGCKLFLGRAAAGSPKVRVQPAVPKHHVPARSVRHGTLPDLDPRPQPTLPPLSWANTLSLAKSVSLPRHLVPQGPSAADAAQGAADTRSATSSAEGQDPAPADSQTRDVGVQVELQEREETVERETTECSSGKLWSTSLGPSDEADTVRSTFLPNAGPRPSQHPEPLPASVLEGAESSDSSKAVPSVEEAGEAPVLPSACKDREREEPANAMPESSTHALGETARLQDPGETSWEAGAYSEIQATIRRICEKARKEMMMSSGNTSGPCSVSMPRLVTLQAADDSASAADASQGVLGNCATGPKAEGPLPVSDDPQTTDVQAVQQTSEETTEGETAGSSAGELQSPSEEAEAETECSACLPDAGPMPAERPEPLPASVLEDAESSGSSKPASSPEEASSASLSSESEGGEREEGAMAMPESSGQALGEAQRLQDPRETARDTYGNPPIHPAIRRIRDENRRERMLPSWNTSRRRDVRIPTLQRFLSSGDAFSTAGTVQGNLSTRPSRTQVRIHHHHVHQRWPPRLSAVLEEISDGNDGAAGTARDMQDAKDTVVTNEGVQDLRDSAVTEDADPQHEVSRECVLGARHEIEAEAGAVPGA
ncbi:hypothetical protein ASZ78_011038 [Callipepla squamata]|uniref:Uncharacterized protein n=1 Tax=Callipepla squamata TaxID=9009 RepID=A0A226MCR4_CALSU|nr:hypothetical protein ASZ78_011038 [Callipepla squamata]